MDITGNRFGLILATIFLILGAILSVVTLRLRSECSKTSMRLLDVQYQIDEITNDFIDVDSKVIHDIIDVSDIGPCPYPRMFMIIPRYPCSACLDRESDFFKEFAESGVVKCGILVPNNRMKDARALFNMSNVTLYPYSQESLGDDTYWGNSEKIIYFLLKDSSVTNIMVTSKYSERASESYFRHVREMM